ncbi:P-loop containing nucleoside triphosphate hydrolase protein [Aspergillus coremiiformis]|uniref:P-loop containing nucleoside triphosphate hydrolase protein n=1 Tax=Aspergillus coremiiformis TaxID=138285 RepID=A0A5N6YYY5_9EURO|nr:P-loop containing nucleoside triphosphate hydrolase protein [Aspergillus coremiiformis]
MAPQGRSSRSDRLNRFFDLVLCGKRPVASIDNVKLLLEAVQAQSDHAACVERIIASSDGRSALHKGMRFSISPEFLDQVIAPFLVYLADPTIKQLCNGKFLQDLLMLIIEPRTLWNALMDTFQARRLSKTGLRGFSWLLVEVLCLPASCQVDLTSDAQKVVQDGSLLQSSVREVRTYGYKVDHMLRVKSCAPSTDPESSPGGRHDNDYPNFRNIAIYPTSKEFLSTARAFYRRADEVASLPIETRIPAHLDNQFRLLREDMLSEIRDEIQIARGQKKGRRFASLLQSLSLVEIQYGDDIKRLCPCTLAISCQSGLETLTQRPVKDRAAFLNDTPSYLKHQSFGCLIRGEEIIAFCTLQREVNQLVKQPPVIVLRVIDGGALKKALLYFKLYNDIHFLLVDAPVFAYEPILRCLQEISDLPLSGELLGHRQGDAVATSPIALSSIAERLRETGANANIQGILKNNKEILLDPSQLESFLSGLTQCVSLIQGPPGTGKSFVGALLAKSFHDQTDEVILVMCYTNHALNQFLEDLLNIGVDSSHIVRLGPKSKCTPRTLPLAVSEQSVAYRRSITSWSLIDKLRDDANETADRLGSAMRAYKDFKMSFGTVFEFLEFEHPEFYEAFNPPEQSDGMTLVGEGGRNVDCHYLYDRWVNGKCHGMPNTAHLGEEARRVWAIDHTVRQSHIGQWKQTLIEEQVAKVQGLILELDECQDRLGKLWNEKRQTIINAKRIIGCTTTGAAKFSADIKLASPGIVLLEEAGEILESHVLAAIGPQTKQLVLIGDHQQLRPKINNYALSVEKGHGYDLNRSLFERLVVSGYPHSTLAKQHRMCPEISRLVRSLSYPALLDDPKTLNRPPPRGLQDRVIFINHTQPEEAFRRISDRRDEGTKGSKSNVFEAQLILKVVRYLGQQGYGTDKLVVLTPYLGQLHLLREHLQKETDPVLNDLDSYDLVRAGLLSQASARHTKRPIRLSTIDNFQGEESDIVIATLTRSNEDGDIGFMAAPQRLNVLLSRARDVLIMIGNAATFTRSKTGKAIWAPFIDQLSASHHLYDGLPVRCEQHPQRRAILRTAQDFDTECPDGGCQVPCGTTLNCGVHDCPSKCHQLADHSKMTCHKVIDWSCSRNHHGKRPCFQRQDACRLCIEEDRAQEQRRQRDTELENKRLQKLTAYMRDLAEIQNELAHERRLGKDKLDEAERQKVLQQHRNELETLRTGGNIGSAHNQGPDKHGSPKNKIVNPASNDVSSDTAKSEGTARSKNPCPSAEEDWKYQKEYEGAKNTHMDDLMSMIGLESIKQKFLDTKAQVDAAVRQNIDLKGERFGSVLMGNPGTGKTTVASIYAKFLTSMGVLSGSFVVETTGSRLANEGVSGCEKQINRILNHGGGVLFIDEAYQLAQGHGSGLQVIDFLLGEVERLTGKVVVVLAGYRSHMEKFFAHNPGLPSRFPHELMFNDYADDELRRIFEGRIEKKFGGRMKAEGGMGGLYCRIVARRIGRQRGHEGFGNARAVENACSRILGRQAQRLARERRRKPAVDDLFLTKEDMIGPEPSYALQNCSAWQKLQSMIGLNAVKTAVQALLGSMQYNYHRELSEKPVLEFTLNRVFLGSPGTGKTTVAKLYGQILVDIGYLSNGEVIVKNPADFVGSAMGVSEANTKGILASTVGKVLVIDEAYGLYGGGSRNAGGATTDPYRTAVVDTIVAEVQSTPGDDRCVLLLGYQEQMSELFQNVNPGLSRRFPMDSAFVFEDFTDEELGKILDLKLKQQGFEITSTGRKVALEVLGRARNRPNFGNAGEIDILLNTAKLGHQQRLSKGFGSADASCLEPQDFDKDYDRAERTETNIPMLFAGVVGCEKVIRQLEGYRDTVKNMRKLGMDPREQVPFNFLFRGPPGTGKTSTARKMGKVYYDMGLLASADVIESSATDLVGQYVGQTGPKAQALLEKALGKVLLVDEAYRLGEGPFAKEAMDEIVDCITKPKFFQKLIVILAGYDTDINRLMAINPGLTSRFPESLEFNGLTPDDCIQLLTNVLRSRMPKSVPRDMSVLESPGTDLRRAMHTRFLALTQTSGWANARDVQTVAKAIFGKAVQGATSGKLVISEEIVLAELDRMQAERADRQSAGAGYEQSATRQLELAVDRQPPRLSPFTATHNTETRQEKPEYEALTEQDTPPPATADPRDSGVSDATWNQLQRDKLSAEEQETQYKQLLAEEKSARQALKDAEKQAVAAYPDETKNKGDDEKKRRHEQERLQRELERRAQEDELSRLQKQREEAEKQRRKEQETQKKLRTMGVCCMGFRWIKQARGYRCAGGSHYVSNEAIEAVELH